MCVAKSLRNIAAITLDPNVFCRSFCTSHTASDNSQMTCTNCQKRMGSKGSCGELSRQQSPFSSATSNHTCAIVKRFYRALCIGTRPQYHVENLVGENLDLVMVGVELRSYFTNMHAIARICTCTMAIVLIEEFVLWTFIDPPPLPPTMQVCTQ